MVPPLCSLCKLSCSSKAPILACHGHCGQSFHFACVHLPIDIKDFLKNIPGLAWRCDGCRSTSYLDALLSAKLAEFSDIFAEKLAAVENNLLAKVEDIDIRVQEKLMEAPNDAPSQIPLTFAQATSASSQTRLLVKPKNQAQDVKTTKSVVLKKVDPVKLDVKVLGVKPARGGGIILGCNSVADSKKMLSLAQRELSEEYEVKEMHGLLPSVRLVGLSEKFDVGTVEHYLKSQNEALFSKDAVCNVIKVEPLKNKNSVFYALVKVDSCSYQNLLAKGNVLVGLDGCSIYDAFSLTRCYCCNELNHISSKCPKKNNPICGKCSEQHNTNDCTLTADKFCCCNCKMYNEKHNTSFKLDHAVWEYSKCSSYKNHIEKAKKDLLNIGSTR